ncbi:cytochrome C oxidase subunit IV family protein [Zavarzinia compransoris]|nr:cytochrome C oxidase subunit IV family protein [Zavarzinia compransoris]TDP47245.1 cytochrome c oxidase subunit IV [Zavarzinia compransoris]
MKELGIVWIVLAGLTGGTAWLFEHPGLAWSLPAIAGVAAVKAALVMHYFMDLRLAPWGLRLAAGLWLAAALAVMLSGGVTL